MAAKTRTPVPAPPAAPAAPAAPAGRTPESPEVQAQGQAAEAPATFDWDALLPPEDAPTKTYQAGKTVDVFKEIPAPIRQRIEDALSAYATYTKEADARGTKTENRVPQWKRQPVASEAQGKKFADLAKKYAKYRPEPKTPEGTPVQVEAENVPAPLIEFQHSGTPDGQITVRAVVVSDTKDDQGNELPEPRWAVRYQARTLQSRDTRALPGSAAPAPAQETPASA